MGLLSKSYRCQMLLLGFCEPLRDFTKVCSRSQEIPFVWNKSLGADWVGPQAGRDGVSGNPLGATCVIWVDGTCVCRLGAWRAQKRNNCFCLCLCTGPVSPPALALKPNSSMPPHMSLAPLKQLPQGWSSEQVSLSASKAGHGPFKKKVSASRSPPSHSAANSAGFHSQSLWGFFFLALESWAGEPSVQPGPLALQVGEGILQPR